MSSPFTPEGKAVLSRFEFSICDPAIKNRQSKIENHFSHLQKLEKRGDETPLATTKQLYYSH
jgi:hypothetical protein